MAENESVGAVPAGSAPAGSTPPRDEALGPIARSSAIDESSFWRIVAGFVLVLAGAIPFVWTLAVGGIGAIVALAFAVALWFVWRSSQQAWLERERGRAKAAIQHASFVLQDAWLQTSPEIQQDPAKRGLMVELSARLAKLEEALKGAAADQLCHIESGARMAARKRAHLLSDACIMCEATSAVRQMELWGVPRSYVEGELFPLLTLAQGTPPAATALEQLFDEYDYWDHYTNRYVGWVLPLTCVALALTTLECLGWSLYWAFDKQDLLVAFLLAGAAGASLSVLLKLPPLGVYGQLVIAALHLLGRFTTGVAVGAVGLGLVTLGVVNLPAPTTGSGDAKPVSLAMMVQICLACRHESCSGPDAGCSAGDESQQLVDGGTTPPAGSDASVASDAAVASDVVATLHAGAASDASDVGSEQDAAPDASGAALDARSPPSGVKPPHSAAASEAGPQHCAPEWMLALLSLALLLGFSERAFTGLLGDLGSGGEVKARPAPPRPTSEPPRNDDRNRKPPDVVVAGASPAAVPPPPAPASGSTSSLDTNANVPGKGTDPPLGS